jgi:o-succinylbenzoate synthase
MLKAGYFTRTFDFKFPAGTSRGVLHQKTSSFIVLEEVRECTDTGKPDESRAVFSSGKFDEVPGDTPSTLTSASPQQTSTSPRYFAGIGECSTIPGLSPDPMEGYETKLKELCEAINFGKNVDEVDLKEFPSIRFGLEMALLEAKLKNPSSSSISGFTINNNNTRTNSSSLDEFLVAPHLLFPSPFTLGQQGININGLIWMGDKQFMHEQIARKLDEGFRCLKMKVGALDFDTELEVLRDIRRHFSPEVLEIRVDANGAFSAATAMEKLNALARFQLHSIEQPIRQGQYEAMASLCRTSPLPIALDEELISYPPQLAEELLRSIQPAYIILKPSLLGGFAVSQQWIDAAEARGVGWWVTSALESNIGLNAIAQWTYTLGNPLPQGLGTGQLYTNNIASWLTIRGEWLTVCE